MTSAVVDTGGAQMPRLIRGWIVPGIGRILIAGALAAADLSNADLKDANLRGARGGRR